MKVHRLRNLTFPSGTKCTIFQFIPNNHTIFPNLFNTSVLVTRYLNNIRNVITSFQTWSPSDSVAKWITGQTSDREVCSSISPRGKCFYHIKKDNVPSGFHTWIICVEVRYPYHITNVSDWAFGKKVDGEWFMKLMRFDKKICHKNLKKKRIKKKNLSRNFLNMVLNNFW